MDKMLVDGRVEGYVVEGFPFVFETREGASRASFPSKLKIDLYEEKEDNSNV
jgi:hypothetical protein